MRRWAHRAALIASLVSVAGAGHAAERALVVGQNQPLAGSDAAPLAYADDDALRMAELLTALGVEVTVLTTPDAETAARMPALAARARPPTRAAVREGLAAMASASGPDDTVWLYFSGHGSVDGASAWLHLADGKLTRDELRRWGRPAAEAAGRLNLVIDACNSWLLVNPRGARVPATPEPDTLADWPRAGALLSTSREKEVHEWAGFRGGVFTHQLIGALRGAADVDVDGAITYAEAHAYLVAANLGVRDARARIEPHVHPPRVGGDVLVRWGGAAAAHRARLPRGLHGRLHIDDARGERILDAHKAVGTPLEVWLPVESRGLALHRGRAQWRLGAGGTFVLADTDPTRPIPRGLISDAFRADLFAQPLSVDFVAGFGAGHPVGDRVAAFGAPERTRGVTIGLLIGAGVGLAAGAILTPLYLDARDEADARPITADTEAAGSRATRLQVGMGAAWGAGGALLTAAALHYLLGS